MYTYARALDQVITLNRRNFLRLSSDLSTLNARNGRESFHETRNGLIFRSACGTMIESADFLKEGAQVCASRRAEELKLAFQQVLSGEKNQRESV